MSFPARVERYREIVQELAPDYLTDIVLAIIENESEGQAGIIATEETVNPANLPTDNHGIVRVKRALGLMQVIPTNIVAWNQSHARQLTWEDMTGHDMAAAAAQIQIGVYILKMSIDGVIRLIGRNQINEDTLKLGLVAYSYGIGHLREKFSEMKKDGLYLSFANLSEYFPTFGAPKNRPIHFANVTWSRATGQTGSNTEIATATATTAIVLITFGTLLYTILKG